MPKPILSVCCLTLAFLLHPSTSFSQQVQVDQGASVPNSNIPHHPVTGIVTNALTGEPIRHALVRIFSQGGLSALTGVDGRFQFENVAEGVVAFQVQKPGFSFDQRTNRTVAVSSATNEFRLLLSPDPKITGVIKDSEGEPLEGVMVQAMVEQIVQGRKQWQLGGMAQSEEDGSYQIDGLVPGRYIVYAGGKVDPPEVSVPHYYPDAPDLASAQALALQTGQALRADFRLRTERCFRVTAQLRGGPAAGAGFALENTSGAPIASRFDFDQTHGTVTLDCVPSGTWLLTGAAADGQGHQSEIRQEFSVNHADVNSLQIAFQPNVSIPIAVNHQEDKLNTSPSNSNPGLNATLNPIDSSQAPSHWTQQHGSPPTLQFDNVRPGNYKLSVQTYGVECVDSAWSGGADLLRDSLVVAPGSNPLIAINMRADCSTLVTNLKSADHIEQAPSVLILVVPASGTGEPKVAQFPMTPKQMSSDLYRSQSFTLAPGSYQVYAISSFEGIEYANPDVLRAYPSQSVDLTAGQKTEININIAEGKEN